MNKFQWALAHRAARTIKTKKTREGQRQAILRWCQFVKQALRG